MTWQLQQAKQRFSELVDRARREGPQTVTRHGEEAVVVLSVEDYRKLVAPKVDFKEFLLSAPDWPELEIERSRVPAPRRDDV